VDPHFFISKPRSELPRQKQLRIARRSKEDQDTFTSKLYGLAQTRNSRTDLTCLYLPSIHTLAPAGDRDVHFVYEFAGNRSSSTASTFPLLGTGMWKKTQAFGCGSELKPT
jgi:hypothetical protein